ncbi:MAG TPA: enoyl-CoA hydratase/isomerase family protein [Verrucomicrobiae bacterium]|nr:enoyl-CoA hydratase/isomerase family protein [Verrucomicrobiae bacterium]
MTSAAETPLPLAAVRVLAGSGHATEASALAEQPWLIFRAGDVASATEARRLAEWLHQLPCPTLAVAGRDASRAVLRACDVVLRDASDAAPLLAGIRRAPLAAAVLVQLLRVTEKLRIADALYAESLAYATLQGGAEHKRWLREQKPATVRGTDSGSAVEMARSNGELVIELNRPSRRNAIGVAMRDGLVEAFQLAAADDSIAKVRLRGRGKCFSVGGDLDEFGQVPDPATAHAIRMATLPARWLARCADRVEADLHSACIGAGIELPAFARRVTAAPDTFFQLPELSMGLIPGAGGTVSIPRRIGRQRAAWLMLSGKRINAKTALDWGLVDQIR